MHHLTRLSVLKNLHTKHKQSTEYIRCRPFKPGASTWNSTLHIQGNNQFENIICFDTRKLRNQKKHFYDLQNIYSVHRISLYICWSEPSSASAYIRAHTQRMNGTTHDRTGSCRRLLDYSKGDFILILSFSSSQKKVLQCCSLPPYQLQNNALLIHITKYRHFLCNIFCLLVDTLSLNL